MKVPKAKIGQVWYDEIFDELVIITKKYATDSLTYNVLTGPKGPAVDINAEYRFFDPDQELEFKFITDDLTEKKLLELRLKYGF